MQLDVFVQHQADDDDDLFGSKHITVCVAKQDVVVQLDCLLIADGGIHDAFQDIRHFGLGRVLRLGCHR
jgi:hypothetical protein